MAKLVIELSPTDTGHVIGDFTWDFCTQISTVGAISTTGCTLTELGNGQYILNNPNVVADTAFRLHLTANANSYASGIFSLSDDNKALQTTLTAVPTNPLLTSDARLNNLDAAVSSRSTFAGGAVASVTAPVTVGTNNDKTGYALTSAYDAAKTAASATAVGAIPTNPLLTTDSRLGNLDATISSRNAIAPDNADISTILTMLNSATYGLSALKTLIGLVPTTSPDNTSIAAIKSDVENATYGLAAIKTALGSVTATTDLSPVTSRLDNATYGLAALLAAIGTGGSTLTAAEVWSYLITSGQTAQDLLAQLYIPPYVGPVVVVPANNDPDVQYVHFYGKNGDITPAVNQVVSAVPSPGQIQNQNLIAKQKLSATLDSDGYGFLTLIRGIEYRVLASWWGNPFTFTVTALDANRTFAAYVADAMTGNMPATNPEGVVVGEVG